MLSFLKNHPFAVEAFFESSLVLTFAVEKEEIGHLIPECLELDTFHDRWAFVAVAMVQTKDLRPKGLPKMFGNDFFLIGYRIFTRYTTSQGKRLRGLYIIKSQTNKKKMELFGNIFTHYNYSTTDIRQEQRGDRMLISSQVSDFTVDIDSPDEPISLPEGSPFATWDEARRFAGPLPFTFTYNRSTKKVLIIEGVRQHWQPRPVRVHAQRFAFIESLNLNSVRPANAFIIHDIPYYWKKGVQDIWQG